MVFFRDANSGLTEDKGVDVIKAYGRGESDQRGRHKGLQCNVALFDGCGEYLGDFFIVIRM